MCLPAHFMQARPRPANYGVLHIGNTRIKLWSAPCESNTVSFD